ncbi:sphingomyelin phosphodiesterase 4 isoform X1 [Diorhabda sublineata]|uniref:sphingomyelin phosphodiesterase 4 isoform X1 n=2 Tax=Diorhabda sublineata TaxID=1163346 RepID=UPI0024E11920|nr:sphingomyelin phosphodiesterase 4 isoform X1 [Diorhabda sublineata]
MIKEQEHFMVGVQHALRLPIRARCAELTVLLDRGNLVELHSFFPILIENIFGPQGTVSWGLRTTTENDQEDFRQLQHFLSPCGPIFKLIYTLLKDPNIRYEFSLAYLPSKIKQFLENSQGHPFYSELLHSNLQTKQTVSLMLNSFDYYMFHFAYHLINPWQQRAGSSVVSWNTVYYVLCCDYILHFLPTDPSTIIQPVIYYNGKNPLQAAKMLLSDKPPSSGLINAKREAKDEGIPSNLDFHHPRNDIWRSETVLTVFTDMWLHNNQVTDNTNNFNNLNTLNSPHTTTFLHHNELPTGEYMRIVRVLVKQLHSFHASAKADDTHLGELKKMSIPMIQGKFYIFLRNLIHRWPLDGSFRLVLELWLTYLQPWRYPPNNLIKQVNKKDVNPDIDDLSAAPQNEVDYEYIQFVAENLLTYTVIFQQLLPRFGRVDLVSPKMSLMLYRIAKVFDQPNLPQYIREIEQCVENNGSPTTHNYSHHWTNNLPPLSPTSNWSTNTTLQKSLTVSENFQNRSGRLTIEKKWSTVVKQKIFELEGPNFCYKPLFLNPPAPEVFDLIIQIRKSIKSSEDIVRAKEAEERENFSGFWGNIKYFLSGSDPNDEFTLKERQKVPLHLQVALQNLIDMFNINNEIVEREYEPPNSCSTSINSSNDYKFLTPERIRARIKNIRYEGDPDLKPIQSYENAFLVRILYQIASKINEMYGPTFYQLYHRASFMGKLSREILCPPTTIYRYDKSTPGSPRLSSNLPPRLSLRFLANYTFLGYLFFGAFVAYLLGYRIEVYFAFLIVIYLFYKSYRALRTTETPVRHNYPTQGFGNISFNDSF